MKKPAKTEAPKQSVVPQPESQVPATIEEFEEHAGEGLEHVTARDLIIPRLTILQAMSPQLKAKKAEYIEGAKIGDICDVGNGELFEEPLEFLPVHYLKQWLEWAPRDSGKGLVKIHNEPDILDDCIRDERNRTITKDGNLVAETAQFFGLNLSAGMRRSFLPMASTQLKKARKWLTLATGEKVTRTNGTQYTPPLFYRIYLLGTVPEENASGDWVGWRVERGRCLKDVEGFRPIMEEAIAFRESITKGEVRGDVTALQEEEQTQGSATRAEDKVPF